jgi:HEAT repeat protein
VSARWVLVSVAVLALAVPAFASPPPRVTHARLETRAIDGTLEKTARAWAAAQSAPAWLGYEVRTTGGQEMCCYDSVDDSRSGVPSGCRIEQHGSFSNRRGDDDRLSFLDDETGIVLLRAEQGRIGRIRMLSRGCGIDAGGLGLVWIDDVKPAESLALLGSLVGAGSVTDEDRKDKLSDGALMAIAMHEGAAADDALERFLDPSRPVRVRKQAAFWMGVARGRRGYEALSRLVREDASDNVREHAVFALSQNETPEAVDAMIRVAREDRSTHVRGQALFWLGQKAGKKAVAAITSAIENDPETEIKKKAVFALSQLPKDEGVPRLIEVAKSNRNPEVRKQAMFWLGQTGDARALAFFQEVLGR